MLFRLEDVTKSYGAVEVLRGVTCQINPGEKVGLVGRNGAGKSTLFKLVCRLETPDTGSVHRVNTLRIGVLEQHPRFSEGVTIIEAAQGVFSALRKIESDMRDLEHEMAEHSEENEYLDTVLEKYSRLQHAYEEQGGFTYRVRCEEVLMGLGFAKDEFDRPAVTLSGGQQGRLHLAMLLLGEPDVLLLDEPTNHLDLRAVEWLEEFLIGYKSAYVVISHDRFLLDRVTNRTVELDRGIAKSYAGSFSEYLVKREAEREIQQKHFEQQQEEIARVEEFIRRNLAGQKTKQAKSRRNQLERLDRLEAANSDAPAGNFNLKPVARTGEDVLFLDDLTVGYDGKPVAQPFELLVRRLDRVGVIGPNGAGKSTLLKTVLGEISALSGDWRWGAGVKIGYYDQRLQTLTLKNTVLGELQVLDPAASEGTLRSFLAQFLFSGDDVYKLVESLSGGERGRLALAKLIYGRANVLVLDEPTNHLDIASCEALEAALNAYTGTCLIVSHDRYFLDRVATRILYLEPDRNTLFEGTYSELWEARRDADRELKENPREDAKPVKPEIVSERSEVGKRKSEKKKKTRSVESVEAEIALSEAELEEIGAHMSMPETASNPELLADCHARYEAENQRLEALYAEWEEIMAETQAAETY